MRNGLWPLFTLLSFSVAATQAIAAQTPTAPAPSQPAAHPTTQTRTQPTPAPGPDATILQAGTQLVVVDVVVEDKSGNPIHGLRREDFAVTENKAAQTIHTFDEHTPLPPSAQKVAPVKLPAGTFTDYTPVPPNGALNILLLDALNTPMTDQSFVRYQLQQYVKHANPGTRIAIFGLTNRLLLLQGFTSDPETLKNVIDHKLIARASTLLDDPAGSGVDTESMSDQMSDLAGNNPSMAQAAANVADFEAQTQSFQAQLRLQYTLDAFNTLGHYLAAFPGRKNVIWFSGSFPIDIMPDDTLADPFSVVQVNDDEFRETTGLLTRAQVAVYPIDARGLMTIPMFSAANSGRGYTRNPGKFSADLAKFNTSQAQEHMTMEQMASDTGGHAFYNTNGLADAVAKAIQAGSNFYTLTYVPTDHKQNGAYREIRVNLTGPAAARSVQLSYRHGYFADDPRHPGKDAATAALDAAANNAAAGNSPGNPQRAAAAYATAAMSRGAPAPEDLLFKVRVLPASTATEATVAAGNTLDPRAPLKGPFRRYDIDCVSLARELSLSAGPNGKRTGGVELVAYLYDPDGKLLNAVGRSVHFTVTPAEDKQFLQGILNLHLEIRAPLKRETYLRIGLHDLDSNRFGVVEIPVLDVSHLAPAVYAAPPASPAAAPAPPPGAAAPR